MVSPYLTFLCVPGSIPGLVSVELTFYESYLGVCRTIIVSDFHNTDALVILESEQRI